MKIHILLTARKEVLSFCVEKPVVQVGNQMEQSISLEIFPKKDRFFHTNEKRSLFNGMYSSCCNLFVEKCSVPFSGKFSPFFSIQLNY